MIATLVGALMFAISVPARAQGIPSVKNYTRTIIGQWLEKYRDAKPQFKAGDVLTAKDLNKMRPFIPPGYVEYLAFPEFKAQIVDPTDHMPHKDYLDCTEKHQFQVKLKADGSLDQYTCGQPFPSQGLSTDDAHSGLKAAWDFNFRWQNYGLAGLNLTWTFVRFSGSHTPPVPEMPPGNVAVMSLPESKLPGDTTQIYGGGGTFPRNLQSTYQRVYFSHLAQLASKGGVIPMPSSKDFEFKDFIEFFEPFDYRGYAFIIFRYADPFRKDDAWGYIPNLRLVRRLSVEVKSDSVLGSDQTLEDFYGFSGRPLDWNWKFLGYRDVLSVADAKYLYSHLYGPIGMIPDDVWSLRRQAVIERTPKDPHHPYSSVVMFVDVENWYTSYAIEFDRQGKLWKMQQYQSKWSETYDKEWASINQGVRAQTWQSNQIFDVQNDRGTILMGFGCGYPTVDAAHVAQIFDVSKLEAVHR